MTDQLAADGVDDEPDGVDDGPAADGSPDQSGAPGAVDEPADARPERQRVSRWDRPPAPRDWRFYVGGLGRILIATGLLLFGFVAYQLWGTGIETARAQHQLENEFEVLLAEYAGPTGDEASTTTEPAGESTSESTDDSAAVDQPPVDDSDSVDTGTEPDPADDPAVAPPDDAVDDVPATAPPGQPAADADVAPSALDLSEQAVVQDPIPRPERGDPLLRLEIPAIGRDDIVVPGVGLDDLKDGPGHYPDTPLPGQLGNAAIAGHRTTYGAPFYDVDRLSAGDEIIATLLNGDRFVYEVTSVEVVEATDYWVVTTTDPAVAELTLTSCHPKYTARDRIVVHSVLNPGKSSNVGVPTFYELEVDPDEAAIPGDDPVLTAAEPADPGAATPGSATRPSEPITDLDPTDGSSAGRVTTAPVPGDDGPGEPVEAEATPAASSSAATAPASAGSATTDAPTPIDAFEQGWFQDTVALPQILLWAAALTAIAVAAYQIAKRFRRVWVGLVVGTVPFLVALYFFYQNVNRLLPAGI